MCVAPAGGPHVRGARRAAMRSRRDDRARLGLRTSATRPVARRPRRPSRRDAIDAARLEVARLGQDGRRLGAVAADAARFACLGARATLRRAVGPHANSPVAQDVDVELVQRITAIVLDGARLGLEVLEDALERGNLGVIVGLLLGLGRGVGGNLGPRGGNQLGVGVAGALGGAQLVALEDGGSQGVGSILLADALLRAIVGECRGQIGHLGFVRRRHCGPERDFIANGQVLGSNRRAHLGNKAINQDQQT